MNNNVRKLTEAAPLREVQDHITRGGAELHYRFRAAPQQNAPLIIRFHGAIQRESRPLPAFQPNLRQVQHIAHQITICDPTMMSREGFSCSWYPGHEKLPAQAILNQLGVDTVMRHFFSGRLAHEFGEASINQEAELICDEELLDQS